MRQYAILSKCQTTHNIFISKINCKEALHKTCSKSTCGHVTFLCLHIYMYSRDKCLIHVFCMILKINTLQKNGGVITDVSEVNLIKTCTLKNKSNNLA